MKAITSSKLGIDNVELIDIDKPIIKPNHILIKVSACGINHGDLAWIDGVIPRGISPQSQYDVAGVSGSGAVVEVGENTPCDFKGKQVAFYRALCPSDDKIGTWCEYVLMHYLDCIILPDNAESVEYSGSPVNIITPYAFLEDAGCSHEKGVIATAGTSATGLALLGIAQTKNIPVISIVRNEQSRLKMGKYNAQYVLAQTDDDFDDKFKTISHELNATAVFDGVGGSLITRIAPLLPFASTLYAYGFLAEYANASLESKTVQFNTSLLLMNKLVLTSFGGFSSETVKNQEKLKIALNAVKDFIHMPHFKTKIGREFALQDYKEAFEYSLSGNSRGNAIFKF